MKSIKNKTKNFANLISKKFSYGLVVLMTSVIVLNCPSSSSSSGGGGTSGGIPCSSSSSRGTSAGIPSLQSITKVDSRTDNGPTLAKDDFFGRSIVKVRDIEGGGTVLAVGASGSDIEGTSRGAIYLLSFDAMGALTGTTKIEHGTPNGPILEDYNVFGGSIANVGDLDGGGGTVIAVGATGDATSGGGQGAIHLLSFDVSGTLTGTTKVTSLTLNGPKLADSDQFGRSIANVCDLDGGGGTVIAVGATGDDTGGERIGAIHLLSYDANGMLTGTTKVAHGITNGPILRAYDRFGASIAKFRDIDGGGTIIAVGARRDDTGGRNRGAIHLLSYDAMGALIGTTKIHSETTNGPTLINTDTFGASIANVGDLYNDGGTVLAVGATGDDTGPARGGAIHSLSFDVMGTLTGTTKVAHGITANSGTSLALEEDDAFGFTIANVGDLDGGGGTVIAVGAFGDDTRGIGRGAIYLFSYQ